MTDRIERNARLLCKAEGVPPDNLQASGSWERPFSKSTPNWRYRVPLVEKLAAAGLTLTPLEPSAEQVDEMAAALDPQAFDERIPMRADYRAKRQLGARHKARAAYRAGLGEG